MHATPFGIDEESGSAAGTVRSRWPVGLAKCPGYAPEQGACMADYTGVWTSMQE